MIKSQKLRVSIAFVAAALSEIRPVPGLLGATLIFPQGAESEHALSYLVVAMLMNLAMVFTVTYLIFGFFIRREISN